VLSVIPDQLTNLVTALSYTRKLVLSVAGGTVAASSQVDISPFSFYDAVQICD
jgi:hypothetical protein